MKKFNLWGLMAGIFCSTLALLSFTSCGDDDINMSVNLSGDWQGDFGMYYDFYDRHGRYVDTFDSYDTDISFLPDYDYATHGYGYQVDYYDYGPYTRVYHSFEWNIRNEVLYLHYAGESELDTAIFDYFMNGSSFTGYFEGSKTRFSLRKYRDFYWDPYWNDFGYYGHGPGYGYYYNLDWDYDYYYARTRGAEAPANAVEIKAEAPVNTDALKAETAEQGTIRLGNRFKKN